MNIEEILEKYGDIELKFKHYYKYSFTFKGISKDGDIIEASIGGISDEIYKLDIDFDEVGTIRSLDPNFINISRGDKNIASWDNY